MSLEDFVKEVSTAGFLLEGARIIDVYAIPFITPHVGNFPFAFLPVYFSGIIGSEIEKEHNKFARAIGKCLPGITTLLTSSYLIAGELINGLIPGNYSDVADIPAIIVGTCCGYVLAKYYQRRERYKKYMKNYFLSKLNFPGPTYHKAIKANSTGTAVKKKKCGGLPFTIENGLNNVGL